MIENLRLHIGNLQFYLSIPAMLTLLWIFEKPEEAFKKGPRRTAVIGIVTFYVLGVFLPLIKPTDQEPGFFFCSLWNAWGLIYGVLLRKPIRALLGDGKRNIFVLFIAVYLLLWFQETFVAIDDQAGRRVEHMIGFIGFYIGLVMVVTLGKPLFISVRQVFTVGGIWGVLLEQRYLGIELLSQALRRDSIFPHWPELWSFLTFAGFIFGVYGFYLAGPFLLFHEEYKDDSRQHKPWKSIALFLAVWITPLLTAAVWHRITGN